MQPFDGLLMIHRDPPGLLFVISKTDMQLEEGSHGEEPLLSQELASFCLK